jgi:hypothetical protein
MRLRIKEPNLPASQAEIDTFEKEFNFKLPEPYKQFLLLHNGGWCDTNLFFGAELQFYDEIYVEKIYSLSEVADFLRGVKTEIIEDTDHPDWPDYDEADYFFAKGFMYIGLAYGDIIIGIRNDTYGKVYYSPHGDFESLQFLAEDFDQFINGFKEYNGPQNLDREN